MTNCPPWLPTCPGTLLARAWHFQNLITITPMALGWSRWPKQHTLFQGKQQKQLSLGLHRKNPRDFTALTTRMSTVMGNSDSLFRLFSSCGDKRNVQSCHTEPQTGIREEENAALPQSFLGRSKWLRAAVSLQKSS